MCHLIYIYIYIFFFFFFFFDTKNRSPEEVTQLFEDELSLLEHCLRVNPKAYCVWLHREWTTTHSPAPDWKREKELCDLFLKYDERNCISNLFSNY